MPEGGRRGQGLGCQTFGGGRQWSPTPSCAFYVASRLTTRRDIRSPLIHVKDLRKHGVTLYFLIDKDHKPVHDVPAVYFVQPTQPNVDLIAAAASRSLYDSFQLNFSSSIYVLHVNVGML
ncbi:hypothetical protein RHGRI_014072 [Rhododendron griersonianum]|uniref:Sec1-like protein n=1 Tax=Rhododendron griersonianum TaxID=479676 RepID=A0AAV6K812_9ERIC|nr:hypothetical protein RHGRI_014072 [Rhododendron griersonianum]